MPDLDYLVQHEGLYRFRENPPPFEQIVDLWKHAAMDGFDVATLDWSSLSTRVRQLMAHVAAPWPWCPGRMRLDDAVERLSNQPTEAELLALVDGLATGAVAPDFVDWDAMTPRIRNLIWVFSRHEIRRLRIEDDTRRRGPPQKKAMALLRSLITPTQLRSLRSRRYFLTTGATTGHVYRLGPYWGHTERVTKHGKRWFVHTRFCLHDPQIMLPPADVVVGHLLLLRSDEPKFLELANATDARGSTCGLWNSDWLTRLARRRRERAEAA